MVFQVSFRSNKCQVVKSASKRHETPYFVPNWGPQCCFYGSGDLGGLKAYDKRWGYRTESQNMAFLHFYRLRCTPWRFHVSIS